MPGSSDGLLDLRRERSELRVPHPGPLFRVEPHSLESVLLVDVGPVQVPNGAISPTSVSDKDEVVRLELLLPPERGDWWHPHGPHRRQQRAQDRYGGQEQGGARQRHRIQDAHSEEEAGHNDP